MFYRITNSTHIAKVPMKRPLSDTITKMDVTVYLAEKGINSMKQQGRKFVVAWGSECQATHKNVAHLQSSQEEADTKILLHALDATAAGATEIRIHSPDTDVFILALRGIRTFATMFHSSQGRANVTWADTYGWERKDNKWQPVMTQLSPAPEAVIQLVKCNCIKERSNNRCDCRKAGLKCADFCTCSEEEELCYNVDDDLVKPF